MQINLTPAAVEELKKISFKEDEGIRIEAVFVGSCTIADEHSLKIDKKYSLDDLFEIEGIPVIVSKESQKNLHEKVTLDFNPNMGYKLSSAEEVYRYNLTLEKSSY
ncbi:iron-sulfur cluster biosynthesis family protein [Mesobacillus foraminis]|uniref:iron-sulfur cluster biosynthesis family protein n=1 Tax=Mesobacillus foraminis TaxID=279826 RepID=UPI000EF54BB3|nr:iron-sulfur cluster biosynthesis family protein [Mesobacillus foraminis]MBT2758344.1 iron-sulfur cluster biosynthesis family protein [Mesobacillus foraminis]